MMRKFVFPFLFITTLLFQSCVWNIGNDEYIEEAKDYLIDNYAGSFVYESISKSNSQIYVSFKATNLNNAIVTVVISEHRNSPISVSHTFRSNYLCCRFAQQEANYYKDFFEEYFPECEITIDNSKRFIVYHGVWSVLNDNGEWVQHSSRNPDFDTYMDVIKDTILRDCITIVVKSPSSNSLLSNEDYLKASLIDLQNEDIKLDGYFYIVNAINDNYEQNHVMAARINAYDSSKYNYDLLQ